MDLTSNSFSGCIQSSHPVHAVNYGNSGNAEIAPLPVMGVANRVSAPALLTKWDAKYDQISDEDFQSLLDDVASPNCTLKEAGAVRKQNNFNSMSETCRRIALQHHACRSGSWIQSPW